MAPQRDLAARRGLRHRRQIDRDHVHRDTTHGLRARAVDQHRRAAGGVARVAVGVAAGDHADAQRLLGDERAAVAHCVADLQLLRGDQLRAQRHRRPQLPVCGGVRRMIRGAAVHHDARPHPIGRGGRGVAQQRGAVGERAFTRQAVGRVLEHRQLRLHAAGAVGIGKMRHQRDLIDLRQRIEPRPGGAKALRREAEPVHAAVQFEKHPMRVLGLVRGQPIDLRFAVHRVPQVQPRAQLEIARLEAAFEQQHRTAPAEGPHALGFGEVEQRKTVGRAQRVEHALDAVAVGIGLDHGPDARARRQAARARQVVRQRIAVDQGFDRTRHAMR